MVAIHWDCASVRKSIAKTLHHVKELVVHSISAIIDYEKNVVMKAVTAASWMNGSVGIYED